MDSFSEQNIEVGDTVRIRGKPPSSPRWRVTKIGGATTNGENYWADIVMIDEFGTVTDVVDDRKLETRVGLDRLERVEKQRVG